MSKHFILLSGILLIALTGCTNEASEMKYGGIMGPPCLKISFIDSEGRDLVAGIPTVKFERYTADFLTSATCRVKVFINEEESEEPVMRVNVIHKEGRYGLYDVLNFIFDELWRSINDKSNSAVYTVRCEVVCPYIFGNGEMHTLTGELSRRSWGYWFNRCWFDGVEVFHPYHPDGTDMAGMPDEEIFVVQVNRY